MMVDPQKAAKLIRQHFEELTTEQFVENICDLSHEAFLDRERKEQQRELETLSASLSDSEALPTEK
ncbi:MAG TPA: hypothetical protein V6C71_27220 [Coleofasciculaceae cyanobacterium]